MFHWYWGEVDSAPTYSLPSSHPKDPLFCNTSYRNLEVFNFKRTIFHLSTKPNVYQLLINKKWYACTYTHTHIHNEILKKIWCTNTCYNTDELHKHYAQWNETSHKKPCVLWSLLFLLYILILVFNLYRNVYLAYNVIIVSGIHSYLTFIYIMIWSSH